MSEPYDTVEALVENYGIIGILESVYDVCMERSRTGIHYGVEMEPEVRDAWHKVSDVCGVATWIARGRERELG